MAEAKPHWLNMGDEADLERVREALGRLGTEPRPHVSTQQSAPPRLRRHFAKDGEVSVEVRPAAEGGSNLLAAAQTQVLVEREARQRAEEELAAARRAVEDLQTRLAHQDMSLREAQEARMAAEAALAEVREGKADRAAQQPQKAAAAPIPKRPRGRPRKYPLPAPAQEPIWDDRWLRR